MSKNTEIIVFPVLLKMIIYYELSYKKYLPDQFVE